MTACEHIDDRNKRDCTEEATHVCLCCGSYVCFEHWRNFCMFGGQPFITIEEADE